MNLCAPPAHAQGPVIASHRWLPEGVWGVTPGHRNFLLPARPDLAASGPTGTRGSQGRHCLGDAALPPVLPEPGPGCPIWAAARFATRPPFAA